MDQAYRLMDIKDFPWLLPEWVMEYPVFRFAQYQNRPRAQSF